MTGVAQDVRCVVDRLAHGAGLLGTRGGDPASSSLERLGGGRPPVKDRGQLGDGRHVDVREELLP
ncbi:hypothetical protein ABZY68_25575 [Streptomyces sp. NPDC006482]|uniref:hypothetical protein n=1 Tax=Streptomyces sp. NPDC006482 TaxID=3154306 RepID=UPI0033A9EF9A